MRTTVILVTAFFFCSLTHPAKAAAPAVAGDVQWLASPPASVDIGDLESNSKTFLFLEQTGIVLPANLNVNIVDPGSYQGSITGAVNVLPGGGFADTYFVHFDPVGTPTSSDPALFSNGSISFAEEVLAIITQDGLLEISESLGFGAPGTLYPAPGSAPGRGVDAPVNATDTVQLSPDRHTVSFLFAARNPGDQMRIIVASQIPEPSSLLLLGLCGVVCLQVRGRSARGLQKMSSLQEGLL